MFEDYKSKIKPAKVIVLMLRHGKDVNRWDRQRIALACKDIDEEGPDGMIYFTSKRAQHATNYGTSPATMSEQVLKDSYKILGRTYVVSKHECQVLQDLYLTRYPGVRLWQQWVRNEVNTNSTMLCASGHVRKFFGRYNDHGTHREAYAHEPQANTTYATNLALFRLWTDIENRQVDMGQLDSILLRKTTPASFKIEPLHHVHDALNGQFAKSSTEWAISRIRSYFDNPLTIAGQQITIPFEGAYGPSWGQLGPKYGGGTI